MQAVRVKKSKVLKLIMLIFVSTLSFVQLVSSEESEKDNPLQAIRALDYTIIFARNMPAMRDFYQNVLQFPIERELGPQWVEFRVGSTILALTERGMMFDDKPTPDGALSLQLAFRVPPTVVDDCAEALEQKGVEILMPPTDQSWGHRTLFFRDPDGNILEIYADI